ncbi:hypothetical protein LOAG_15197 [Loa loa]|uniref:Uncharacterized protein n=1 Tax=Loa loa TaxID=7209 RepID=A0A1S0THK2_LOALO|nr:hypothetical protein LOAG_15197 [Loa loa]EFO13332.1 hypothetical protein LOAG_15197 [Loa loa]
MNLSSLQLFAFFFTSICILSNSQKLPGLHDITTIAKIFSLPNIPYYLPKFPLFSIPKRTKLFGLPPLPNNSTANIVRVRLRGWMSETTIASYVTRDVVALS